MLDVSGGGADDVGMSSTAATLAAALDTVSSLNRLAARQARLVELTGEELATALAEVTGELTNLLAGLEGCSLAEALELVGEAAQALAE